MIGAIIFKLRAAETALLPSVNGRLLHAAFFHMVEERSPALSAFLHDGTRMKPFTVSMLRLPEWERKKAWHHEVPAGTVFYWRVTALREDLLKLLLSIPAGTRVQAGKLPLTVEEVICNPERQRRSGLLDERDLMVHCFSVEELSAITVHFLSPTSFRVDDLDFALPLPDLLWGSLMDKWTAAGFPLEVEKEDVKAAAACVRIADWKGRTETVYFGKDRGTLAFRGRFTYDLTALAPEWRRLFLLLAQFATFSGAGRLSAQGLGEVEVCYS